MEILTKSKRFPATIKKQDDSNKYFLDDDKIDGELYGFLQSISDAYYLSSSYDAYKNETRHFMTVIYKSKMPTQSEICARLKRKRIIGGKEQIVEISDRTLRRYMTYLIERGYLIKITDAIKNYDSSFNFKEKYNLKELKLYQTKGIAYILPDIENYRFYIPTKTLKFLMDTATQYVIKAYIYFGQRWAYWNAHGNKEEGCLFTLQDLADSIGLSLSNHSENYDTVNNVLCSLHNNGFIDWVTYNKGNQKFHRLTEFSSTYKEEIK